MRFYPVISKIAESSASSNDLDSFAISLSWLVVSQGNFRDLLSLPMMLGLHPNSSSMKLTMQDVVFGFLKASHEEKYAPIIYNI